MEGPETQGSDENPGRQAGEAPRTPTVVWISGTVVRVTVIDEPVRAPRHASCHCDACRAAQLADWAEQFLP